MNNPWLEILGEQFQRETVLTEIGVPTTQDIPHMYNIMNDLGFKHSIEWMFGQGILSFSEYLQIRKQYNL